MRLQGLSARVHRRFKATTDGRHQHPVAEHILNRGFRVHQPNVAWASDITAIATREGWLYLAVVIDLYSRRVIGSAMNDHVDQGLAQSAIRMAIQDRKPPPGTLFHSDRGSQVCKAHRPDVVRPLNHQIAQEIRIHRACRMPGARVAPAVEVRETHVPHQGRHMPTANPQTLVAEQAADHPAARERVCEVQGVGASGPDQANPLTL